MISLQTLISNPFYFQLFDAAFHHSGTDKLRVVFKLKQHTRMNEGERHFHFKKLQFLYGKQLLFETGARVANALGLQFLVPKNQKTEGKAVSFKCLNGSYAFCLSDLKKIPLFKDLDFEDFEGGVYLDQKGTSLFPKEILELVALFIKGELKAKALDDVDLFALYELADYLLMEDLFDLVKEEQVLRFQGKSAEKVIAFFETEYPKAFALSSSWMRQEWKEASILAWLFNNPYGLPVVRFCEVTKRVPTLNSLYRPIVAAIRQALGDHPVMNSLKPLPAFDWKESFKAWACVASLVDGIASKLFLLKVEELHAVIKAINSAKMKRESLYPSLIESLSDVLLSCIDLKIKDAIPVEPLEIDFLLVEDCEQTVLAYAETTPHKELKEKALTAIKDHQLRFDKYRKIH